MFVCSCRFHAFKFGVPKQLCGGDLFAGSRNVDSCLTAQETKPADSRLQTDAKRGVVLLLEAIHRAVHMQNREVVAESLCDIVVAALQTDPLSRPTAAEVHAALDTHPALPAIFRPVKAATHSAAY